MRRRPLLWLTISVVCFVAGYYFWKLGDQWAAEEKARPAATQPQTADRPGERPFSLVTRGGNLNAGPAIDDASTTTNKALRFAFRLSNTDAKIGQLARTPTAVLLENALIDTRRAVDFNIPSHLRAPEEPGAWIVQARGEITPEFRSMVAASGAKIISYIPNNAFLVTASKETAQTLRGGAQAVLPYEPYYKLKSGLLKAAAQQEELPEDTKLRVLLFDETAQETVDALAQTGAEVIDQTSSPFGPVVTVKPQPFGLADVARQPGVQAIELARERIPSNDLSRPRVAISTNSVTIENYMGLTGTNVLVSVNDTGVDETHPDLTGRVMFDVPIAGVDSNGHGTHVAGIIASSGEQSTTVTTPIGSITPTVDGQFRGKAPGASIFSMYFQRPDLYLQQTAARTNALISNNSWEYRGARDYDLAAASYDAAVRDSLPTETGSQGLAYVFASGNSGGGSSDGGSGNPDTILSPGTAKNVITVGAVEMPRNVTNETWEVFNFQGQQFFETNKPWIGETDSNDEVADFSSRGNVGISIEGEDGRFKPDVVAPGTMVISTRSTHWDTNAYYNNTNYISRTFADLVVDPGDVWVNTIFIPVNAVELRISVHPGVDATFPFPDLPIFLRQAGQPTNGIYDVVGTNQVILPRDGTLSPIGTGWFYGIGNPTTNMVSFTVITVIAVTNQSNFNEVLQKMNDDLGPYYRYESGSSMAAAQVSGTLALMHEFFIQRLGKTNSPALMKALLINGARPFNPDLYDLNVRTELNSQGWGMVNLTNSLPGALATPPADGTSSMLYYDQSPTNALVTGASHIYPLTVRPTGASSPLRITLVWTDPPGNPVASIKLVNDLDLVVTNLDTGDVYFGNDIGKEATFNSPWDTNEVSNIDIVNNVESISLPGYAGTNLTVSVIGRRVNVNAVTAHPNDVAQDYALVISSGNGRATNALQIGTIVSAFETLPLLTVVTNAFEGNADYSGNVLYGQHTGAHTPLLGTNQIAAPMANGLITLGMTNQWHFYAISNEFGFTNAAFMTFLPPNLAVPRMGATDSDVDNASRVEADVDMYVTTEPGLTNLDQAVIERSIKSLGRNGSETVILSNAVPAMYYIGVKAEDQQAAEYAFAGVFSRFPFSEEDALGNQTVRGFPVPQEIPDAFLNVGGRLLPGMARILAFSMGPDLVRRVIVTNSMAHELIGDLTGTLIHGRDSATLNNHTTNTPAPGIFMRDGLGRDWEAYVYDDSEEKNVPFAHQSDGPGSLMDFGGKEGAGQWMFTQADGAVSHIGTNGPFIMFLEKQPDLEDGIEVFIEPGACRVDYVRVPAEATNLTVEVTLLAGTGPIGLQVCPLEDRTGCKSTTITNGIGGSVTIDFLDDPPLQQGVYSVRTCNLGTDQIKVRIVARIYRTTLIRESLTSSSGQITLKDDAISYAYITNLTSMRITSLDVGLLFNHPRISDMAITLISPNGTRVLLFEDRGGLSTNGMGSITASTNGFGEVTYYYSVMRPFYMSDFDALPIGVYSPMAPFEGWRVVTNYASVLQDWGIPWRNNQYLSLEDSTVHLDLPTTNAIHYELAFKATHTPYITGTVGWWPFEGDGQDIFGGFDALLLGGGNTTNYSMFRPGKVNGAFFGDAIRTSVRVPAAPELNVAKGKGFTVEGWIYPIPRSTNAVDPGSVGLDESFESIPLAIYYSPTNLGGWQLTSGTVDNIGPTYRSAKAHTGARMLDLNGWGPGRISTNLNLVMDQPYRLSFAYAKSPDNAPSFTPEAQVSINGIPLATLDPQGTNTWTDPKWNTTSRVFTVSSPTSTLTFEGLSAGASGVLVDSIIVEADQPIPDTAPLVEWVEASNNVAGLKFWLSGLAYNQPRPGALVVAFGTNGTEVISTGTNLPIVNRRWQHVALSYDTALRQAKLYVDGQEAASQFVAGDLSPVTSGDLFFGFHPGNATNVASFKGGLDEFGLYRRALGSCELAAIYNAGAGGKYSTNALTCPVAYELTLQTDKTTVLTITNGLAWTNGPIWELNSISFTNPILSALPDGVGTNLTGLTIRPLTPNVALDEFVLSSLTSNQISGAMQFTENTNLALVPIKFAPPPYTISNFPPTLVFTNGFLSATQGLYTAGSTVPGLIPELGRDWLVTTGSVTVLSNRMLSIESTNALVLGEGTVETTLPTTPGRKYELTWRLRGPGAVGWWNGDIEPLSGRALDLIGMNHGAMINRATNSEQGFVMQPNEPDTALLFRAGELIPTNPYPVVAYSPRIELSDPPNLRLTNALTIEGWINPRDTQDEFAIGVGTAMQQIFYRGDGRDCLDPYYLGIYYYEAVERYDIVFHVEDASGANCGINLYSTNQPVRPDIWQHVAAVFEANVPVEGAPLVDGQPALTNKMSIYLDGDRVAWIYTSLAPFADLDPSYTPGASIGNRSRYSRLGEAFTDAEPFIGLIDDLTIYGRALTTPEIRGIYDRSVLGKSDPTAVPSQSLAKAQVFVDNLRVDLANGENDRFTTRTAQFVANRTNATVKLEGLLPGTIVDGFTLTEIPNELNYLPEENLRDLIGENSFGVWTLEMWDTRTGGAVTNLSELLQLVNWTLNFQLAPTNVLPVITLEHGVPYENVLFGNAVQHFIVPVPQWATNATNVVLWSTNRVTGQPAEIGVLWDGTNPAPATLDNAMFWPPVNSGVKVLYTNNMVLPFIVPGTSYFLTVTNPSTQPITFSYGVWFDIETLTNCVPTPALANPAGIAKYFQFNVPTNSPAEPPHEVFLSLTGTQTNLALVVSQTLPLPTLERYDYISRRPSTNDQNIMVLTNNTPYPIRHGKWYAGVFNSEGTNVPFTIQVCYSTSQSNAPTIIPLTNNIPFVASFDGPFAAPPGAPKWLFYEFDVTNSFRAMLFELYNLTGDADLIVQRHVPSGMAPYFDGSFKMGTQPESVVVRRGQELADLQGKWYVGVYNNESTNVGYTVRVTTPDIQGLLNTALPLMLRITPAAGPHGIVLEWNSIPGERYFIEHSPNVLPPDFKPFPIAQPIVATTTTTAVELPIGTSQKGFFRVRHESMSALAPTLEIRLQADGRIRVSWPASYTDMMVQMTTNLVGSPWVNANVTIVQEGAEYVFYYTLGPGQRFFRVVPQ